MPPRNRILLEQQERIIRAFEDVHENYLMVTDTIGVNKSTARSIVTRYVRERREKEEMLRSHSPFHPPMALFSLFHYRRDECPRG